MASPLAAVHRHPPRFAELTIAKIELATTH
jgi:hypothetical protein